MYSVYKTVSETIVMEQNSNEIIELKWNLTTKGSGCNVKIRLDAADVFVVQTHQQSQAADPEVMIY